MWKLKSRFDSVWIMISARFLTPPNTDVCNIETSAVIILELMTPKDQKRITILRVSLGLLFIVVTRP
jgi:hypothetical protein